MLVETVRLTLGAVMRNAMRSFLTVLGVVIGVAAVIAMVTVGQGSTAQVQADVASLGSNLLMVRPGQSSMGGGSTAASTANLSLKDVAAIKTEVPGVIAVAPNSSQMMTAVVANENHATLMVGTDNEYLVVRGLEIETGCAFYESEQRSGAAACILGPTPRKELFGSGDPVEASLRLGQVLCRVIGVLASKGASSFGTDQDDLVLMPIRAFNRRIAGKQDVGMIYVSVVEQVSPATAKAALERLMRERRRVGPDEEDDFNVFDMAQISSMLTGITSVLTERTREIGIKLAVGATTRQVLTQFLVEAVVLSLLGGLIGIVLGLLLAFIGAQVLEVAFTPDPMITLLAFAFSAAVGLIF